MTVYVDDYRLPARVGRLSGRWSHLTVGPFDDVAELHEFAARIGLRRSWFQDKAWPGAHYDVTDSKRHEAITAGASAVTWREAARMRVRAKDALRKAEQTLVCKPGGLREPPGTGNAAPLPEVQPSREPTSPRCEVQARAEGGEDERTAAVSKPTAWEEVMHSGAVRPARAPSPSPTSPPPPRGSRRACPP